ncbi:MAG: hypothetical protein H0X28_03380 [Solirubrobacterales bacterium]|nr:hypothetical protein [Solirubrobacterales bacterium]
MSVRFARSATKHRISKESIRHVIAHCGLSFEEPPPTGPDEGVPDRRLVCLGDDATGRPLEVIAVEGRKDELIVIHAMELRNKYRSQYEEAKKWRL